MKSSQLKILQGTGQIGGNIILLEGENSRLVFDFGIPLTEPDGSANELNLSDDKIRKYLPSFPDLYSDKPQKETLFFCRMLILITLVF